MPNSAYHIFQDLVDFLRELHAFTGADSFKASVRAFGQATPELLIESLQTFGMGVVSKQLAEFFETIHKEFREGYSISFGNLEFSSKHKPWLTRTGMPKADPMTEQSAHNDIASIFSILQEEMKGDRLAIEFELYEPIITLQKLAAAWKDGASLSFGTLGAILEQETQQQSSAPKQNLNFN